MFVKLFAPFLFLLLVLPERVLAGPVPPENLLRCVYTVEGMISTSTLEAVQLAEHQITQDMWREDAAVCFNSEGGSFAIGIQLAILLNRNVWRSAIKGDSVCASACAIAFLGGTSSIGMYTYRQRVVYPGGKVGFHAPRLEVSPGGYSAEEVSHAYGAALLSISELLNLAGTSFTGARGFLMNNYLLSRKISTPPSDLWIPHTIHEFALSDIDLWTPLPEFDDGFFINVCDNFVARYGEDGNAMRPAAQIQNERSINREGKVQIIFSDGYAWVPGYWRGGRNTMACRVNLQLYQSYIAGEALLVQLIEHDWDAEPPFDPNGADRTIDMFRGAAPIWFGFDPNMRVRSLR